MGAAGALLALAVTAHAEDAVFPAGGILEALKARVGKQIRAGNVNLQGVPNDRSAPFGGYKQSGNGREWGKYGMEEYLEVKAIAGFNAA